MKHLIDDVRIRRRGQVSSWLDYEIMLLELSPPMRLKLPLSVAFLIAGKYNEGVLSSEAMSALKEDLREYIRSSGDGFCVGVVGATIKSEDREVGPDEIPESFVLFDGPAMSRVVIEKDRIQKLHVLGKVMAEQVGVLRLSPYDADEPATRGRFFGRAQTLKEILGAEKNYTIIGPRRIGKTSLMTEIRERIRTTYAEPRVLRTAHILATQYESTAQILAEISGQLLERHAMKEAYKAAARVGRAEAKFKYMIRDLTEKGQRIAVFIDEFDFILELDAKRGYACLALLHAAFDQVPRAQLFLAGFRQTFRARLDNSTPLFGFTETVELGPLLRLESIEMIGKPLADLGVPIEDGVLERINTDSAGHPQVITYFCDAYLKFYDRHRRMPDHAYIISKVIGSPELRRRITGTFLNNTNVFEELVCLLLVRKAMFNKDGVANFEFSLRQVDAQLHKLRVSLPARAIQAVCESLRLCSIIQEVEGTEVYKFTFPQLVQFFNKNDLDWHIHKAADVVAKALKDDPNGLYREGSGSGLLGILDGHPGGTH
jgi:hypothetical protein